MLIDIADALSRAFQMHTSYRGSLLNPKIPWKRRNFVECTINKKSHDLLVQFVNNRYRFVVLKILKLHSPKGSCNFENFQNHSYLFHELYSRSCDFL